MQAQQQPGAQPQPQREIRDHLDEVARHHTRRRRVLTVLLALSFAVALAVAWQLRLTGISMTDEAFCGKPEHVHTQDCVEQRLVCEQEEHTHSVEAGCYETRRALACGQEEHVHSVEAGCYDDDGNLVCDTPEHTHTDDCYDEEQVLVCDKPEHVHSEENGCYETVYTCNLEEHVHTAECYSNSQADLESSADWEASLPALTGNSAADLVSVAVSQLGASESVQNFQLAEDGATRRGYSRYGAWYGNPYGQWGAMFVSFCLNYAYSPASVTLANSGANTMLLSARQAGLYRDAAAMRAALEGGQDADAPQAGDLLFVDADADGQADGVAIVEQVDEYAALHTVQGDSNDGGADRADAVERVAYAADDPRLLGFAQLPRAGEGAGADADADTGANNDAAVQANEFVQNGTTTIRCYAIVNDEHALVENGVMDNVPYTTQDGKRWVRASDLATVYGTLGFDVSTIGAGSIVFPFADGVTSNRGDYWIDQRARYIGDDLCFCITDKAITNVCYLPTSGMDVATYAQTFNTTNAGQQKDDKGNYNGGIGTRPDRIKNNAQPGDRFFTVTVTDTVGQATTHYVMLGADLSLSLEGDQWTCVDAEGNDVTSLVAAKNEAGNLVFTFTDVRQHYNIVPAGEATGCTISYNLNLPAGTSQMANAAKPTIAKESDPIPSIAADPVKTLPTPSITAYRYTSGSVFNRVKFGGWMLVDESGNPLDASGTQVSTDQALVIAAGGELDLTSLTIAADRQVRLRGTWNDDNIGTINCYAVINGELQLVGTLKDVAWVWDKDRYCVDVRELESVYGAYGFDAGNVPADQYLFGVEQPGQDNIWADVTARTLSDGTTLMPLYGLSQAWRYEVNLYYVPGTASMTAAEYQAAYGVERGKKGVTHAALVDKGLETLYSVTVAAETGDGEVPRVEYAVAGSSPEYTVNNETPSGIVTWQCVDVSGKDTGKVTTDKTVDGGRSTRFTINGIDQPYTIEHVPDTDECTLVYDLAFVGTYNANSAPTVGNETPTYTEYTQPVEDYEALLPNPLSYTYTDTDPHTHRATFASWTASTGSVENGTYRVIGTYGRGDKIDLSGLRGKTVTLTANWDVVDEGTVYCYAFVDGRTVQVGCKTLPWYWSAAKNRYCLAASDVEALYRSYGIEAKVSAEGTLYFVGTKHQTSGDGSGLWGDVSAFVEDGVCYIPFFETRNKSQTACDVYYLPASGADVDTFDEMHGTRNGAFPKEETASGKPEGVPISDALSKKNAAYADADVLYSVTVRDDMGTLYKRPLVFYVVSGETYKATLANAPDAAGTASWQCVQVTGEAMPQGMVVGSGADTYTKFEFTVRHPYTIVRKPTTDQVAVLYDLNLTQVLGDTAHNDGATDIDYNDFDAPSGVVLDDGTTSLGEMVDRTDASYTARALDRTEYTFYLVGTSSHSGYLNLGTFVGWKLLKDGVETGVELKPRDTLILSDYGDASTLTLVAQWSYKYTGERASQADPSASQLVNFFVALNAVPDGTTDWSVQTDRLKFTSSVYLADCGVPASIYSVRDSGTTTNEQGAGTQDDPGLWTTRLDAGSVQYVVLGGEAEEPLNVVSAEVVDTLSSGTYTRYSKTVSGETRTYHLTFPDDESVLARVRSMVEDGTATIQINGHKVELKDLTTENFTIRWYVFKMDRSDGWHVDGILTAKTSKLKVSKTFAGNEDLVRSVKGGDFSITVEPGEAIASSSTNIGYVHTEQTLTLDNYDKFDGSYDAATDTYTWYVPVDQYYTYRVRENNYLPTQDGSGDPIVTDTLYGVSNSATADENTRGWIKYRDEEVTVTPHVTGYGGDVTADVQISFMNTYTLAGTVIVTKRDAVTGNAIGGVSFDIARLNDDGTEDTTFAVYKDGATYRLADDETPAGARTTMVTTDTAGRVYLLVGGGTFTLTEHALTGYSNPGTITLTIGVSDGDVAQIMGWRAKNGGKFLSTGLDANGQRLLLTVRNYPRTVSVTAHKTWEDASDAPVAFQLYRREVLADGTVSETSMGDNYLVRLTGSEAGEAWSHTWEDVPLYANGRRVEFFVRETMIGEYSWSPSYADGYRYYDVVCKPAVYRLAGTSVDNPNLADEVYLEVVNRRDTGVLNFTKVDEAGNTLPGAVFKLYHPTSALANPQVKQDASGGYVLYDGATSLDTDATCTTATSADGQNGTTPGEVTFGRLTAGTYYLLEYRAPDGYAADATLYRLNYTQPGYAAARWVLSADGTGGSWVETSVNNRITNKSLGASVVLRKLDEGGHPLTGAAFKLQVKLESGIWADASGMLAGYGASRFVDEDGELSFDGLPEGSYRLVETQTPVGHYRLSPGVDFTVSRGVVTLDEDTMGAAAARLCGLEAPAFTGDVYVLSVTNVAGKELPSTGGTGPLPFVAAGLTLMLGSLAAAWHRRHVSALRGEAG